MSRRFFGPLVAIAVFAGMFFYNRQQESVIRWNDHVLEIVAPLQPASFDVETALQPWFESVAIDLHLAEHALEDFKTVLDRTEQTLEAATLPNQDPTTAAFAEASRAYLGHFQDAYHLYAEVLADARKENPPDPATVAPIKKRLIQIVEEGARIVVDLQSTQRAFADEHGFRLE